VPVDRAHAHGIVGQMAQALDEARRDDRFLWLALAPEGTRSRTEGWRSGFYHVTRQAQVPLALVVIDYGHRQVGFKHFLQLGGDLQADLDAIRLGFGDAAGKRPHLASPIRLA